ncbi:hypothetical protein NZ47_09100 [Anaerovibrio lipolyticus]|uniref:LicD/FKTN/FKRP nucleotidyltransferase domain-containing protein n=1 Tax=Anaerovibrio lipolyticus TaxID=82374 RepID=A0A0B2JYD6_9FIRM|nr:LicD family protein [Anaerovibrio lipolyticus]KHM51713.1 hypothetical protein NZ47_09100 [Anaerovibrio lipolyticus]
MDYVKNIGKDEIRAGFLVTTDRKKIWNKLMELLVELDRVCKKHSITYFAEAGTLIGAARHKGFIPWDDDIDISMLRPDYEKFKRVALEELSRPYILVNAYTGDNLFTISKLMNVDTTAIEDMRAGHPQGIFLDIWPLDDMPDSVSRNKEIFDIRKSMLVAIMNRNGVLCEIDKGIQFKPSNDFIKKFLTLSPLEGFAEYEKFCANHFGESSNVGYPLSKIMGIKGNLKREYYQRVVYLDFEEFKIPAPSAYETVLEAEYGNWQELVRAKSMHATEYITADISYSNLREMINNSLKNVEK